MNKKTTILLIVLIIALGSGILYFLLGGKGPNGLPIISDLPFGNAPEDTQGSATSTDGSGVGGGEDDGLGTVGSGVEGMKLIKVFNDPVAGAVAFVRSGSTYLRFVERATGHVNEVKLSTLDKQKIVNTTRPKIYTALWKKDASGFVERTLEEGSDVVVSTSISLVQSTSTSSTTEPYIIRASLLMGEVGEILVNDAGDLIYNLLDTGVVATSNFVGEKAKTLLSLPYTSWSISPISSNTTLISSKSSAVSLGYAYTLDLKTSKLTKILGPLYGLSVRAKSGGTKALYSYLNNNVITLVVKDLKNGSEVDIKPTTLAEKCTWTKKSTPLIYCGIPQGSLDRNLPDSWYQGEASFNDSIWRFNTETDAAEELYKIPTSGGESIDIYKPELSPDEDYLVFINKKDLSLWVLKLVP